MDTATDTVTLEGPARVLDYLLRLYGLTVKDASAYTEINRTSFHNWLKGHGEISKLSIRQLEAAFELPKGFFEQDHLEAAAWLLEHKSDDFT